MIDAMPTPDAVPAARTVPDLRVGMTVAVHDGSDVLALRGHVFMSRSHTGRVLQVLHDIGGAASWFFVSDVRDPKWVGCICRPALVQLVERPRGETVDASELQRVKVSDLGAHVHVSDRPSLGTLTQRISASLRDANARAARLDAGGGDATGELAGLIQPSINVHDEVTVDAKLLREAEQAMAAYFTRWPEMCSTLARTPATWREMQADSPYQWRWPMQAEPEQRITSASANAGTVKVVKAMQAKADEELRARVAWLNDYARRVQPAYPDRIEAASDVIPAEAMQAAKEAMEQTGMVVSRRVADAASVPMRRVGIGDAVTRSRCSDCKGTGILPGFGVGTSIDACDRPCSCDAGKRKAEGEGPSEWTVVERVNVDEADRDRVVTERVTMQRGSQRMHFRIRACAGQRAWTAACVTDETGRKVLRGIGSNYDVEGEACIPMAIARLLVGLREGTVVP